MKHAAIAFGLFTAACATSPAPAAAPVPTPSTPLAGTPCDPPTVVPAGLIAYVRSQFVEGPKTPMPPLPPEDLAAYQKQQAAQKTNDWASLCYYRADNAVLTARGVVPGRVVFMGDSITQSWGLAAPGFFDVDNVNRGISGQTTPQMALRFKADVLALKPAAVHILGGINDIAGNTGPTTLEDVEANIMSMVELAKAHNVTVILSTILPADHFTWAPALKPADAVARFNAWARTYAAQQDLILADYFTPFATPDGAMKPELTLDGVHPNKAGYNVMEPIAQAAIATALAR